MPVHRLFCALARLAALTVYALVQLAGRYLPAPAPAAHLIVNRAAVEDMFRGFQTVFNGAFGAVTPSWNRIAMRVESNAGEEKYGWLRKVPAIREWVGDRQVRALEAAGYTIVNRPFEASVAIKVEDIERDRYGLFGPAVQMMADEAARHPDRLIYPLLTAGFASTCYDGQFFFDSDHPIGNGTVWSNTGGGSGNGWYLLDTRRPVRPIVFQVEREYDFVYMTDPTDEAIFMRRELRMGVDASLSAGYGLWQFAYGSRQTLDSTSFNAAYAQLMATPGENGEPLGVLPSLLVCGPSNRAAALGVVQAQRLANGADNINYQSVDVFVTPYLP